MVNLVHTCSALAIAALVCFFFSIETTPAFGDTIIENEVGNTLNGGFPGQSITTPNNGTFYNNIRFNWWARSTSTGAPHYATASGNVFLLSEEYASAGDTPVALSSSTSGFIASAPAVGNQFVFASDVTLNPNTKYYFYQDGNKTAPYHLYGGFSNDYAGGARYYATSSGVGQYWLYADQDWSFTLQGDAATVPEPSTLAGLLGMGAVGLLFARRKRRR